MATAWMYRSGQETCGPVPFRDLVRLVRGESLAADNLVKADWEEAWRPAATVVGLFKMAGREDVLARWEAERAAAEEAASRMSSSALQEGPEAELGEGPLAFATADDLDQLLGGVAGDRRRGVERAGAARALSDAARDDREEESPALGETATTSSAIRPQVIRYGADPAVPSGSSRMLDAIESAVAESESNDAVRTKGSRWSTWKARLPDLNGAGSGVLRWGGTLLFANLTAVAILTWSELQTQRFPQNSGAAAPSEIFPFWGPCSSREYAFLFIDVVILAGFCGYLAARYIEAHAESAPPP